MLSTKKMPSSLPYSEKASTRFSLLLLEDGEYYLEDYSVFFYQDPASTRTDLSTCVATRQQGRLKICTRSVIFEPNDSLQPLVKYRFKHMPLPPSVWKPLVGTGADYTDIDFFNFECKETTEMKADGQIGPYTQRVVDSVPAPRFLFSPLHTKLLDLLSILSQLWDLANISKQMNKVNEEAIFAHIFSSRRTDHFDKSVLADFRERQLLPHGKLVNKILPLVKNPGCLMLTTQRVYFQPAQLNNVGGDPVLKYLYTEIEHMYKRRHMLTQCGLELYLKKGGSVFFAFESRSARDEVYEIIARQPGMTRHQTSDHAAMMLRWQRREIGNYEYLMYLNHEADRTVNDLTQYPVMPWVIADYESRTLDLHHPSTFRDLSKPIGALNPGRLEYFLQRYQHMPPGEPELGIPPPFLYGTHYSTPGYVLFYLLRKAPEYMLCLQNGKFDAPDRMFNSISETWNSVLNNNADLKELIPAFYDTDEPASEWLTNQMRLDLGIRQKTGKRAHDVELPAWATTPEDFVRKNREALESEYVSEHLHLWIDLIFGYKQSGDDAIEAHNLFYYLTYEGAVDLEQISDPMQRHSLEAQISEFGQTPKQLFKTPHPRRKAVGETISLASPLTPLEPKEPIAVQSREAAPPPAPACNDISSRGVAPPTPPVLAGTPIDVTSWPWDPHGSFSFDGSLPYKLHKKSVTSLTIHDSAPGSIFSTSEDATAKVFSVANGRQLKGFTCDLALSSSALSPDGNLLFLGCWDDRLYIYSLRTGRLLDKVRAHEDAISTVVTHRDILVTASWDSTVKIWKFSESGLQKSPVCIFADLESSVQSLSMSGDGKFLAAGCEEGTIALYDMTTGTTIKFLEGSAAGDIITGICWSPDSKRLFCCSADNQLSVFGVDGSRLASYEANVNGELRCIQSDGAFIIGGGSDGVLRVWLYGEGDIKEIMRVSGAHQSSINCLTVNRNGDTITTGCQDGSVRVWTLRR